MFQLPLGRLSDSHDRRIVVFFCALGAGTISLLIAILPSRLPQFDHWLIILLGFFWGGTIMTQYAICLAHANDNAAPEDFVMVGSGMLITTGFCSALGGPLASITMKYTGTSGLFIFSAVCMFLFALAIAVRRSTHVLPVESQNDPFRAVADMTTPAVYEMDPRTGEDQ